MSPRNRTRKPGAGTKPVPVANRPSALKTMSTPNVPFVGTERLTSVTGDGTGKFIQTFHLNPGLKSTFSVGHFQAQNYDKYLLTGRNAIRYTPACSTLTTGAIYILIDYDPTDRAPSTEEEFADNELTLTCPAWGKMSAPIQASRMDNCRKLIRTGPFVESKLLTDACAIHIGAFGFGDAVGIGHVHIDYSAKLFVRQPTALLPPLPRNTFTSQLQGGFVPSGTSNMIVGDVLYNTVEAVVDQSITVRGGAYRADFRLGLEIPSNSGAQLFMLAEWRVNGVRVEQSPVVFKETITDPKELSLVSNGNILQLADGDVLSLSVSHDHTTQISVLPGRSLITVQLV